MRPLAWVDEDHVAVLHREVVHEGEDIHVVAKVELVDLRTQATRTLVSSFGGNGTNGSDSWLATGLLDAPVVHASPPPRPPDLRTWALWFASALLVMLLVGGTALWGSRGRRA